MEKDESNDRDVPGGPVVKAPASTAAGMGSTPGQGRKTTYVEGMAKTDRQTKQWHVGPGTRDRARGMRRTHALSP